MSERRVALTFDAEHADRPNASPDGGERILDALRSAHVRATFFVQARWAMAFPDIARQMADDGHRIGNHSTYHARLPLLSDGGLRADVEEAGVRIAEITGVDPRPWFRCPFGDGHDDPRVLGVLGELGYRNVHWDVESEDWEPWRTSTEIASSTIDRCAEHGDGAIVLLHTWPRATADAVPIALAAFADRGVRFVTVDELEGVVA